MIPRTIVVALVAAWSMSVLSSCVDEGLGLTPMPAMDLEGQLRYEARTPTPLGASDPPELRPARFVSIEVVNNDRQVIAACSTDAEGAFTLELPAGGVMLIASARVDDGSHDVTVTVDAEGGRPHQVEVILAEAQLPLDIIAEDDAEGGPAGAFHIVDTMITGLDAAERWTGRSMPPVVLYWGRGVTTTWSFYYGEEPEGSGRYAFEILGGQPGAQHTTDTDEHDEVILLHELGHMVMELVSTDSSIGGPHPPGMLVDPGLAWEEGRVSWFATAVAGDPAYQDTVGVVPDGYLRVDRDFSRVNDGPQGISTERTVSEVLWALSDGFEDIPDADDDGVALGPQSLIETMMDLTEEDGAYPCLSSFLWFLIDTGRVEEAAMRTMLDRAGQPPELLPATRDVVSWPIDVNLPGEVSGAIDGLTDPAPSGGEADPETGVDATAAYRFHLVATTSVELLLTIDGSGTVDDHTDLDLELRDIRAQLISTASTAEPEEHVGPLTLDAGWYVAYVRDGGDGNRADYVLTLRESSDD